MAGGFIGSPLVASLAVTAVVTFSLGYHVSHRVRRAEAELEQAADFLIEEDAKTT